MKYRKASVADILWFTGLVSVFIIVMIMQLEFSNTATIDAYVKNIVNTEATRFVSSIAGYSLDSGSLNMYDDSGNKLTSSQAIDKINVAKNTMISNIRGEFSANTNLSTRTKGIVNSDVNVSFVDRTNKSTIVTITVKYTIISSIADGDSGITNISDIEIPRKVVVTRVIENPMRFK